MKQIKTTLVSYSSLITKITLPILSTSSLNLRLYKMLRSYYRFTYKFIIYICIWLVLFIILPLHIVCFSRMNWETSQMCLTWKFTCRKTSVFVYTRHYIDVMSRRQRVKNRLDNEFMFRNTIKLRIWARNSSYFTFLNYTIIRVHWIQFLHQFWFFAFGLPCFSCDF